MNLAVIFAGGVGSRMNAKDRPKQFLLVHGKPIIVHTIELFQYHEQIDGIIVVCVADWIDYMEDMKYRYRLDKIGKIVPGGETGQMSIYNGLCAAEEVYGAKGNIVLIHDGVRPLINAETITDNIACVKAHGSAVTCTVAKETVVLVDETGKVDEVPSREMSRLARAPQSFWLDEILEVDRRAISEGKTNMIDSCTMMRHYGHDLHVVIGPPENIKITTPDDFYTFRALYDARENSQLV
ncbi:MAG: 2-C-methyl-D-erythritol 4-phosphate cytidylyltransferase [Clostridia bacterium]|nr:2-C-methyl-D-erythritol 4-phosphate cytidylyltransferase [Clostridia bacterium]MBR0508960.1 2-C-methyl-D-erythritol 4-phosphate cytidylyltransferase [Clostridia bacterium]MBR0537200.1 2-C-methyl-D-erythritol 4-phosphate cytidylyltransferase [Clostridia bacterium]